MGISDMAKRWVASASLELLKSKLAEYSDDDGRLSPRDAEMRMQLRSAIKAEISRRRNTG